MLVPNDPGMRAYGANPYVGYDSLPRPFLYGGEMPDGIPPLTRVVSFGDLMQGWSIDLLRQKQQVELDDGTVLRWKPGQNSALDSGQIARGKDVGSVTVQRDGTDTPYFVDFAFAFHAFFPEAGATYHAVARHTGVNRTGRSSPLVPAATASFRQRP